MNYKIKNNLRIFSKIFNFIANNLFLIFLLLLLIDSILIGYLFFKYSIQEHNVSIQEYSVGLDQKIIDSVLDKWGQRENLFEAVDFNQYLDLFRF